MDILSSLHQSEFKPDDQFNNRDLLLELLSTRIFDKLNVFKVFHDDISQLLLFDQKMHSFLVLPNFDVLIYDFLSIVPKLSPSGSLLKQFNASQVLLRLEIRFYNFYIFWRIPFYYFMTDGISVAGIRMLVDKVQILIRSGRAHFLYISFDGIIFEFLLFWDRCSELLRLSS